MITQRGLNTPKKRRKAVDQGEQADPIMASAWRNPMRHVLLVEDDAQLRLSIKQLLEEGGFTVTSVADGMEALIQLSTHPPPNLIVLDLMMPTFSGWEFLRELRAHHQVSRTPVLVASAFKAAPLGFEVQGFIQKPFDSDEFLEIVGRLSNLELDATPAHGQSTVAGSG
jgi:CheY-like chemotaxis protein